MAEYGHLLEAKIINAGGGKWVGEEKKPMKDWQGQKQT